MADASYVQSNFLGGQWSPNAQGRSELPAYKTALALCYNMIPLEEGAVQRRSGTRDIGLTQGGNDGQIKEFWLPNNQAAVIELTPGKLRVLVPSSLAGSGAGYTQVGAPISTPYSTVAQCRGVRIVQAIDTAFFFIAGLKPQALVCTNYSAVAIGIPPTFSFVNTFFDESDGPYVDPLLGLSQTGNSLGMVSDGTPAPVFTISDGAYSFVSTDQNRGIRLWSQPPAWDSAFSYPEGSFVTYQGTYWRSLVDSTLVLGVSPGAVTQPPVGSTDVPTQAWTLTPDAATWSYGYISAVLNSSQVDVTLLGFSVPTQFNGFVIDTWQLGLFTDTGAVWPSCGCYHEGRLWVGGIPNRIDGCVANAIGAPTGLVVPSFSPTDPFGNVLDDSGISYPLNLSPEATALWMIPDHSGGILIGTAAGELLLRASTLNDPITPTSISIHQASRYKSQNSEPISMGIALGFIQAFGRRLMEYVADVFSQKFIARHINEFAKDLTTNGIRKICYQEELAPVIWAATNANDLIGCTYRRVSHFGTEGPLFTAWHQHFLGSGNSVNWVCTGTSNNGTEDVLMLLTQDNTGSCHIEMMQPLLDVDAPLIDAWYLDTALSGGNGGLTAVPGGSDVIISGAANNKAYTVWIAGLNAGRYTSSGTGTITVPYGSDPDGLLTQTWLASQLSSAGDNTVQMSIGGILYNIPLVIGQPYTSTITLLRPIGVDELRTQNGPGLAKTRRTHMFGVQFANTITGPTIAIDAGPIAPILFRGVDQATPINSATLYSGVHWDTIDDDYSFDSQISVTRFDPYPMTIAAVTAFLHTQDR